MAPKKKGGRTGRKVHSNNNKANETAIASTPEKNTTTKSPTGGTIVRHSLGRGKKQPKKSIKKRAKNTVDETVDGDDEGAPTSVLIQIPENLLNKTSRSMMSKPIGEVSHHEKPVHKAEQLLESNQAFVDNIAHKGWPHIGQEFLMGHRDNPGINMATRYVISLNVPPDTDYYDANKIEIPGVDIKFIIASAPTNETESRENFWRMVYDSNVTNIFYMENQPECAANGDVPFLPTSANDSKDFGKMCVSNKKVTQTVRDWQAVLEVLPEGCSNSIIVRFAQSMLWPDRVVVESEPRKSILHLVRLLKEEKGQVLVVCKNGMGRSCMFVMVHSLISLLNAKALKEIPEILYKLRQDRWGAIQTEQQYLMVHQAALDYVQVKTLAVKNCDDVKRKLFKYAKVEKN